jgi:hypothetical protein
MFLLPPKSDATWVYDDPSGVPDLPARAVTVAPAKPKRGKVVRVPVPAPATPKAA